jgi:hypothetical protein
MTKRQGCPSSRSLSRFLTAVLVGLAYPEVRRRRDTEQMEKLAARCPDPKPAPVRNPQPRVARQLPALRPHRRDPDGRRCAALRRARDLEGRRHEAARQQLPGTNWTLGRGRLLALVRDVLVKSAF